MSEWLGQSETWSLPLFLRLGAAGESRLLASATSEFCFFFFLLLNIIVYIPEQPFQLNE